MFGQQAKAIGKLFTIAANFTDPAAYFLGGGVVEAAPALPAVVPQHRPGAHRSCGAEQKAVATFALVADLDMAGARGAAVAALERQTSKSGCRHR